MNDIISKHCRVFSELLKANKIAKAGKKPIEVELNIFKIKHYSSGKPVFMLVDLDSKKHRFKDLGFEPYDFFILKASENKLKETVKNIYKEDIHILNLGDLAKDLKLDMSEFRKIKINKSSRYISTNLYFSYLNNKPMLFFIEGFTKRGEDKNNALIDTLKKHDFKRKTTFGYLLDTILDGQVILQKIMDSGIAFPNRVDFGKQEIMEKFNLSKLTAPLGEKNQVFDHRDVYALDINKPIKLYPDVLVSKSRLNTIKFILWDKVNQLLTKRIVNGKIFEKPKLVREWMENNNFMLAGFPKYGDPGKSKSKVVEHPDRGDTIIDAVLGSYEQLEKAFDDPKIKYVEIPSLKILTVELFEFRRKKRIIMRLGTMVGDLKAFMRKLDKLGQNKSSPFKVLEKLFKTKKRKPVEESPKKGESILEWKEREKSIWLKKEFKLIGKLLSVFKPGSLMKKNSDRGTPFFRAVKK